jgi:hypothetical protein
MGIANGRKIKNGPALELATTGRLDSAYRRASEGLKAFILTDDQYLTEVSAKSWVLWPSKQAYEDLLSGLVAGRASDPVLEAIGAPSEFIRLAPELSRQFLASVAATGDDLLEALPQVEKRVKARSGPYWSEDQSRLRLLIAYTGEVLKQQEGWVWEVDERDGAVLRTGGGGRVAPGRVIVAQADEAKKGEFELEEVLAELTSSVGTQGRT